MRFAGILLLLVTMIVGCSESPTQPITAKLIGPWAGLSKITYPGPDDGPISDSVWIWFSFEGDGTYSYGNALDAWSGGTVTYTGSYTVDGMTVALRLDEWSPTNSPLHPAGEFEADIITHIDLTTMTLHLQLGEEFPTIRDITLEKFGSLNPDDFGLGGR